MNLLSILLLSCCAQDRCRASDARAAAVPRAVLIVADDLGWPEVPLMPSLAALAAGGTTFDRAYSFPTCSPTRLALLSGRYPRREGIGDLSLNAHLANQDRLRLGIVTLAEAFAPTHATGIFGKWHLGRAPLDNGGDLGLNAVDLARAQIPVAWHAWGFETGRAMSPTVPSAGQGATGYYDWWRCDDGLMTTETQYAVDAQREAFSGWVAAQAGPWFAVLAFSAPHTPYDVPPGGAARATTRAAYEQVVAYLDSQIAMVLAVIPPDTFVFFTSDNGTPDDARPTGSEGGAWKGSTREGGVRVPLIVSGPGVVAGGTTSRLVSVLDIGATLAELCGVAVPGGFDDALSFADELGPWAGAPARGFVFTERYEVTQSGPTVPQPAGYDSQAVIEASWKLARTNGADAYYFVPAAGAEMPLTPGPLVQARLQAELAGVNAEIPRKP